MRDIFTTLERKKKRVPRKLLMALAESAEPPKGVLVEEDLIKRHYHFDGVPHKNIRMVDVARALDNESRKANPNPSRLAKLVDRVVSGLSHTVIAIQGRPEGSRILGLINRAFNRILERLPTYNESAKKIRDNRWIICEGLDGKHEARNA